ncbi:C25 family cysteine peptidase [Hymenobacter canadensis]|uniref:C25 family cysteine peptidase n=1 Tax=Hymenobacter canadensis TaxID=2999067 RepID=A0ABY7LXT5_9BACT|nr:C25 family cysteine peptidase [Hymenobacter canadensis]WBA43560.1 C25 family cysteine peptidase [Hymenobacter canadensis]
MTQPYRLRYLLSWCLVLLGLLTAGSVSAQTLYGNEWIVPSQQYYKIKILKDGLYRLDQQYLAQAGISGVNPQRVQLWRRGREVAIFGGGNQTTLDATTYFEFYGQRNDGKLDQRIYKGGAVTQPHDLYSLYTDTAAYFLTWSATTNGLRMAQPALAPTATAQPYRMAQRQVLYTGQFAYVNDEQFVNVYMPWGEAGEGWLSGQFSGTNPASLATMAADSAWSRAASGTPQVEVLLVGYGSSSRTVALSVFNAATNAERPLGSVVINGFDKRKLTYALQLSDFAANGQVRILSRAVATTSPGRYTNYRVGYVRYTFPQTNRWFAGRKQVAFLNDSTLAGPAYYALDSIPATVAGFDITDPYTVQRIAGTTLAGQQRGYVFPSAAGRTRKLLLADEAVASVPRPATRVRFRTLNAAATNFLIVSHPLLMKPVGGVDAVRAYATYRASTAGGRYDTVIVTSQQLYDQFHYGEKSVGAMRNYVRWELANSPATQTNYLLLLGKGLMVGEYSRNSLPPSIDLIPGPTRSASDNFLSADWENNNYIARMPTGRVSASNGAEIVAYLNKLKAHEALGAEPWRKNIVHMAGGGKYPGDFEEFESYVDKYKRFAERPLFGGTVVKTYRRSTSQGSNLPVSITIAPEINAGVSLVTYFGHGSALDFDLNFGDPTDPGKGYNNPNKYPVFLLNGCSANAVFSNLGVRTLSENWIFAENKGAVGFMSDSDLGFAQDLDAFSTNFYKLAFNDPAFYGKPIPVIQAEAARRMLAQLGGDGGSPVAQALANIWLGDPALRFYAPDKPDFIANQPGDVQIQPNGAGPLQASATSLKVVVNVKNPGKITTDPLDVRITRRYPTTSAGTRAPDVYTYIVRQAWRDTTYAFVLPNTGSVFGENCFQVELDYQQRIAEILETNNSGQACFNFLQGGVTTLWPPEFAIVPAAGLRLVGQTNDPRGTTRAYEMELDTVPTFNSALKQTRTVTTTLVPDWRPTLPALTGRDSVVWYWRLRFQTPDPALNENPEWATSSFRVIPGTSGGWSQSHHGQFRRDQLTDVSVAAPSGRWDFAEISQAITMVTRGGGTGGATFNEITDGITAATSPYTGNCAVSRPNIMVAVFNGRTLRPVRNVGGGVYDSCGQGSLRFYHFAAQGGAGGTDNINTPARQAQLQALLSNVRPGDYIALLSMNKVNFSAFPASLKAVLTSLGATRINSLQDGDPYALLVQKGPNPRPAQEVTADPASPTPRASQVITLNGQIGTRGGSGTVSSTRIGPAQEWQTLYHTVRLPDASDSYTLQLVGIDAQDVERVLNPNVTSRSLALAGVSAQQYPYLKLVLSLRDTVNRTAPQLEQWLVTYQGVPEGIVRRDLATPATVYDAANLARQAAATGSVTVPVVFENVSSINFSGPLKARITLSNGGATRTALVDVPGGPLAANAQVSFNASVNVVGLDGSISGNVVVNPRPTTTAEPRALPELYFFNNELLLPAFQVDDRNTPPVLDVAFDGRRILNGEIVSPTPIIRVQLKDDDRLRRIQNANNFDVLLTAPGQTTATRLDLNGSNVIFESDSTKGLAVLTLDMGKTQALADGIYTLEVQGRDATNRPAGSEPYRVTFEVVNASTITNVFPYPNPVTSKAQFVFTLTGAELPRDMKIQILTLTGRVVKEIMMEDITAKGPLRIGNNITGYAWDGTDTYGDRLANGTYLYRVILDDPTSKFSRRATSAEADRRAFKNDWGKIVLIR